MLQNIPKWILISRGWWVTVHKCARRKGTSIICATNLPSVPWNITSKVHTIRTMLKRRSNLLACIGKPLLPQSRKIPAFSKAAAAAAATAAAILYQCIREWSPFIWRKRSFERTEFGLQFLDDRRAENTPLTLSSLIYMVRHHDEHEREEARATHWEGVILPSIEEKIPKLTGE